MVQPTVLHEQDVAAVTAAVRHDDALGPPVGDRDVGGDAVGPVVRLRPGAEVHRCGVRVPDLHVAVRGEHRSWCQQAARAGGRQREHPVGLGLGVPPLDHLGELVGVVGGEVAGLGRVVGQVVQLPPGRVEVDEFVGGQRGAEPTVLHRRLDEARAGPRTVRLPPVVVDRSASEHLEVLRGVIGRRVGVAERVGEARAVDR